MIIDLDKEDFIALIKGMCPSFEIRSHPLIKAAGSYMGGFLDRWDWNDTYLGSLSEIQLHDIYKVLK